MNRARCAWLLALALPLAACSAKTPAVEGASDAAHGESTSASTGSVGMEDGCPDAAAVASGVPCGAELVGRSCIGPAPDSCGLPCPIYVACGCAEESGTAAWNCETVSCPSEASSSSTTSTSCAPPR